ncbi:MAG: BatD family protein [Candidatus Cloacimonetes bacterium]|nr:BatD family protein [Candidatus Cloacimonadota bacterium]
MLLRKVSLIPTRTGILKIPPLKLDVSVIIRSARFFDFDRSRKYNIVSNARKITVKELPLTGRPESWNGAVGNYSMVSNISNKVMKVGDSFTYTLTIRGSGNIKYFDAPRLPEISHMRFIDPEVSTNTNTKGRTLSGSKSIKYLVIAQEEASFEVPALEFSYFDPKLEKYEILRTETYRIDVSPGEFISIPTAVAQSQVMREGADIGFIVKTVNVADYQIYSASWLYWLILLLSLLTMPIAAFYAKERSRLSGDVEYMRHRAAGRVLKKYLRQASEAVKSSDRQFYGFAQTGLANYIADKLKLPRGSTTEALTEALGNTAIPRAAVVQVKSFVDICNKARFMPGGSGSVQADYKELQKTIEILTRAGLKK